MIVVLPVWRTVIDFRKYKQRNDDSKCPQIPGNPDMYGIGIRTGTYLQLIVGAFVDNQPGSASKLAPINLWFMLALFVALNTVLWHPDTHPLEPFIILTLGNANALLLTVPGVINYFQWLYTSGEAHDKNYDYDNVATAYSRHIIWFMWNACNTAYWWKIVPQYPDVTPCPFTMWLFVPGKLVYGSWMLMVFRVLNVLSWVYTIAPLASQLAIMLKMLWFLLFNLAAARDKYHCDICRNMDYNEESLPCGCGNMPSSLLAILRDYFYIWPLGDIQRISGLRLPNKYQGHLCNMGDENIVNIVNVVISSEMALPACDARLMYLLIRYRVAQLPTQTHHSDPPITLERHWQPILQLRRPSTAFWEVLLPESLFLWIQKLMHVYMPLLFPYSEIVFQLILIVFNVLMVELTLILNNVGNVNNLASTGQLVALIVSLGGCQLVAMERFLHKPRQAQFGFPLYDRQKPYCG
ncbi:hypothetical protein BGX38DRAFT_1259594 [Terfezia claveryi]|nr:hypothetical protein BGX38DRAFT_1259594 [Terfezia claveryi]